jgi:hypothetical protein
MRNLDDMLLTGGEETSESAVRVSDDEEVRSKGEGVAHDDYVDIELVLVVSVGHQAHVVGIA